MTALRLASIPLSLLLLLPATALPKPGHAPPGERDVVISSVSRGAGPGDPWAAEFTVLGLDGLPVAGVNPVVSLTDAAGGRYFAVGVRTAQAGRYRAELPAPGPGIYRVMVDDGLGVEHVAGITRVEQSPASAGGSPGNAGWALPFGAAAAGCLLLLAALHRRRGDAPSAGTA